MLLAWWKIKDMHPLHRSVKLWIRMYLHTYPNKPRWFLRSMSSFTFFSKIPDLLLWFSCNRPLNLSPSSQSNSRHVLFSISHLIPSQDFFWPQISITFTSLFRVIHFPSVPVCFLFFTTLQSPLHTSLLPVNQILPAWFALCLSLCLS